MAVGTRRTAHDNFNERVCALIPFKVQEPDRNPCSRSTRITNPHSDSSRQRSRIRVTIREEGMPEYRDTGPQGYR